MIVHVHCTCTSGRALSRNFVWNIHGLCNNYYSLTIIIVDDYRLTAAMSILKIVGCKISRRYSDCYQPSDKRALPRVIITDDCNDQSLIAPSRYSSASTSQSAIPTNDSSESCFRTSTPILSASSKYQAVPDECVLLAIRACEVFIRSKENTDIDQSQIDLVTQFLQLLRLNLIVLQFLVPKVN